MLTAALALLLADTPERALTEFAAAWNRGDGPAAARLIQGADPALDRRELFLAVTGKQGVTVRLASVRRKGEGTVTARVTLVSRENGKTVGQGDNTLPVVKEADGWKLVAPKMGRDILGSLTAVVKANSPAAAGPKEASDLTVAVANMKQIALGSLLYAGDNDDALRMSPGTAAVRIAPYLKSQDVFRDPGTGRSDVYVYNRHLTNANLRYVDRPAETVMWSIGPQGNLRFPYDGKTVIVFADGHVKPVTRVEAAKLVWTP